MKNPCKRFLVVAGLAALAVGNPRALPQGGVPGQRIVPTLEPIAETRLIMEGLAQANFRGLERILKQPPTEDQSWVFGRGQALLLAETANLLMLRPPRNSGEPVWMGKAMDMRRQATQLANHLAKKDFERSRAALVSLAQTCNLCHQTFRVPVDIAPFADSPPPQKVDGVLPF